MINVKKTAGRCKKKTVSFKAGRKTVKFKARSSCGAKYPAQRKLAAAAKACAGEGKIGGKQRSSCLRKALRK